MGAFKLTNLVLCPQPCFADVPELLYRLSPQEESSQKSGSGKGARLSSSVSFDQNDQSLAISGEVDFFTYFNAFSAAKWKRYTSLEEVSLHVELAGDPATVRFFALNQDEVSPSWVPHASLHNPVSAIEHNVVPHPLAYELEFSGSDGADGASDGGGAHDSRGGKGVRDTSDVHTNGFNNGNDLNDTDAFKTYEITISLADYLLLGFKIASTGVTRLKNAYWFCNISKEHIRPIKLAIATTTFKNEKYILPNIDSFKKEILQKDEPISFASHLFVIDNGQSLEASAVDAAGISLIPNANVGGSGGFARGMMEALHAGDFTHVLLMDDDVSMMPESFLRTFNLLSIANETYKDAFLNGAMLTLEKPNMQFEDVSELQQDGQYARMKGNLFLDTVADIAVNEAVQVERPHTYGAWWFSCIPLKAIKKHGLPLPLFIRMDDVEFGIRCNARYMTMNGICVWHAGFGERFRASVDVYQYLRNYLIMLAVDDLPYEKLFMLRIKRSMRLYLRAMAYETAELMVDALEDYLKGPDFLAGANGEEIMKNNAAKNEKLIPLSDALDEAAKLHPSYASALARYTVDPRLLDEYAHVPFWLKVLRTLPYGRHSLPARLLRKKPGTIFYGGATVFSWDLVGTSCLVAFDRKAENAHVRFIDKARYKRIQKRWKQALKNYAQNKEALVASYKEKGLLFTSDMFWAEYLKARLYTKDKKVRKKKQES